MPNKFDFAKRVIGIGVPTIVALFLIRGCLYWTRGIEVARSTRNGYSVVVRKSPQTRYASNPIAYLADSGEDRSYLKFSFTV